MIEKKIFMLSLSRFLSCIQSGNCAFLFHFCSLSGGAYSRLLTEGFKKYAYISRDVLRCIKSTLVVYSTRSHGPDSKYYSRFSVVY